MGVRRVLPIRRKRQAWETGAQSRALCQTPSCLETTPDAASKPSFSDVPFSLQTIVFRLPPVLCQSYYLTGCSRRTGMRERREDLQRAGRERALSRARAGGGRTGSLPLPSLPAGVPEAPPLPGAAAQSLPLPASSKHSGPQESAQGLGEPDASWVRSSPGGTDGWVDRLTDSGWIMVHPLSLTESLFWSPSPGTQSCPSSHTQGATVVCEGRGALLSPLQAPPCWLPANICSEDSVGVTHPVDRLENRDGGRRQHPAPP